MTAGAAGPGLSVIIPTRDSNDTLPGLFRSLNRARAELDVANEVIVVDDSAEANQAELERLCARNRARLVRGGRHVGAKRNLGAAAARFDVLLFVDSDCRASPSLLVEHWATHALAEVDACAGPVRFIGERSWLWPGIERGGHVHAFKLPATVPHVLWSPTANLSVHRSRFHAIGGFDESSPRAPGGEDIDLGVRLRANGTTIHTNPRAVVWHDRVTWSSLRSMVRRMVRYGRAEAWIAERHEEWAAATVPGHLVLLALGVALWSAFAVLAGGPLLPLVWLLAYTACLTLWHPRDGLPGRLLPTLLSMALLDAAFEAGVVAGCLARRRPSWLFRRAVHPESTLADGLWIVGARRAWAWCLGSLLCTLLWVGTSR